MAQMLRPISQELSFRAVILGILLAMIMGAANVYLGLKVGMTVSASIPSAVLAMLILRGIFRTGTIWEANQVQNAASAGESLAAGIIFTMPALIIIGAWTEFNMWMTTLVAFAGGTLGVLFMIPMRRVFITGEHKKDLPFPEAVACAAVLKAGSKETAEAGVQQADAKGVIYGALFGGGLKVLSGFAGLMKGTLEVGTLASNRIFYFGSDISAALLAVGFIVGLHVSVLVFVGGVISWVIGIPLVGFSGLEVDSAVDAAWGIWKSQIRFLGVGGMVVGGIVSIYRVRAGLMQAVRELSKNFSKNKAASSTNAEEQDISMGWIIGLMLLCTAIVAGIYYSLVHNVSVVAITTVVMLVMGFFFTAVASYIVGLVGNSNSPVSGMTITSVLATAALLFIMGYAGMEGMVATIGVAAIVCCVACTSGDMANELKIGHMVGSSPVRQQIMQLVGVAVASVVMGPVMQLLHNNTPGGLGGRELPAPQAGMFASLAQGIFGDGQIPWNMVIIGMAIGVVVLVIDGILSLKGSKFRAHLMPIAVGMYLPFGVALPMLLGGLIALRVAKGSKDEHDQEKRLSRGVLFASGAIAGESLMGVGLAGLAAAGVSSLNLGLSDSMLNSITVVGAFLMLVLFIRATRYKKAK